MYRLHSEILRAKMDPWFYMVPICLKAFDYLTDTILFFFAKGIGNA